jgi:HlyD family secretion protein
MRSRISAVAVLLVTLAISSSCRRDDGAVSGTIEVDEVHVAPRYGGRVAKIFAQEGNILHAGDVIVEMDAAELPAQRNVASAQIEMATHDMEAQAAQLDFLRADSQRQQDLLKNHTVSPNEAERAASAFKTQERNLDGARVRVAQARAQLEAIDSQLREMKILAPGDCILEVLNVKVGDVVAVNREVATLVLPQQLWVRVYVPEPWLGHLKLGDPVRVRVDSFQDSDFKGAIEQINRHAEFTPRNVQTVEDRIRQVFGIKIRLENSEGKLRAGMSADVFFPDVPK